MGEMTYRQAVASGIAQEMERDPLVVMIGEDIGGIAVHIAARVIAKARPGEVVVSGSVPPLVVGSGIEFLDRGEHELNGVPGPWSLFAVRD